MNEHITHDDNDKDAWICICGNTPSDSGFYPIDNDSHEVEPTEKDWATNQYFCAKCGRVIDMETLEVVRKLEPAEIVRL